MYQNIQINNSLTLLHLSTFILCIHYLGLLGQFTIIFLSLYSFTMIVQKAFEADLTQSLPTQFPNTKFMDNAQVKQIFLNQDHLYLIRSTSVLIYQLSSQKITATIQLGHQIEQVLYLPLINQFYAYQIDTSAVISFTNEENPIIKELYNLKENKGNNSYEWSPWLLCFENGQKIILVRKLYGESRIIIFSTSPTFTKLWEFSCNQSSISKMDESQYLVNYEQLSNKPCVKFTIFNSTKRIKDKYKLDNIEPNICKSVKLHSKEVKKYKGLERTWVKVIAAINYKTNGSGILLISLQEQTENYVILNRIDNNQSQINTIFSIDQQDRSLQLLQYCFFPFQKQAKLLFTTYKFNETSGVFVTDCKEVSGQSQGYIYNTNEKELITFSNNYLKKHQKNYQGMIQKLRLKHYRLINKKIAYIHLMQNYLKYPSSTFIQSTIDLL